MNNVIDLVSYLVENYPLIVSYIGRIRSLPKTLNSDNFDLVEFEKGKFIMIYHTDDNQIFFEWDYFSCTIDYLFKNKLFRYRDMIYVPEIHYVEDASTISDNFELTFSLL